MREASTNKPYSALGIRLKEWRQKLSESLAEVSGAVEVDVETLSRIERGEQRPNEAVLFLLINHFGLRDNEARNLWELAGFQPPKEAESLEDSALKPIMMLSATDPRVVYTDVVHVMVNNYGVVLNFMQTNGPGIQPLAVARVGMSKDHAKSVLEILHKSLNQSAPKALPSSKGNTGTDKPKP